MLFFIVGRLETSYTDIEISLVEPIKRRIWGLWRIEFQERTFRHIEQQIREDLEQSHLLLSRILYLKTKHQHSLLLEMLKKHSLFLAGGERSGLDEYRSVSTSLEFFKIVVAKVNKVIDVHISMQDHRAVRNSYDFFVIFHHFTIANV
jgi:hypothetical protein